MSKEDLKFLAQMAGSVVGIVTFVVMVWIGSVYTYSKVRVINAQSVGKAELVRAEQNRQILVKTAEAERDAAQLQAEAIKIMGEAAQKYPEYRQQQFITSFGEALREGKISQIIYVPTEGNIPVLEAGKR